MRRLTLCIAVAAVAAAIAAPAASAHKLPVIYNAVTGVVGVVNPNASPPGANDWNCKPTAQRPRPVVLLHGLGANMGENWSTLAPLLHNEGHCVFALNYGGNQFGLGRFFGFKPMEEQAVQLSAFIDRVLGATGASKVNIVGHSQGGVMPRYYLKNMGGATKVDRFVGLAPNSHGTTGAGILYLAARTFPAIADGIVFEVCESCRQHLKGSQFMADLNAGGDTVPGVTYTVVGTKYEEAVTPYRTQFLTGPNVTNITVQQNCAINFSEHISVAFDRRALGFVLKGLDPRAKNPPCVLSLPLLGG